MKSKETDVARHKPVVYLETVIMHKDKIVDQKYNYERYSINAGHYPSCLTDGRSDTIAYPASWFFDYIIDLEKSRNVGKINLVWGKYGKEAGYITEWRLYYQTDFSKENKPNIEEDWKLIESGLFPNSDVTYIETDILAKRFRIIAASVDRKKGILINWIGMTAFEAYADEG